MNAPQQSDREERIEYREDGKIPIAIWLVWLGFAIFAAIYISRYAYPDFQRWLHETTAK